MNAKHYLAAGLLGLVAASAQAQVTIQTVTIGNPGNANDRLGGGLYGGVDYTYNIGEYDVTLTQYTAFLNAVAATDTYLLYNPKMATDLNVAGIARSGTSGSYTYSVIGSGQRPVTYVSWFDAARFTNWLQNGQPVGLQTAATTEQGAYTLNGDLTFAATETKNADALYWIPSASEWYKAAYYDPNKSGPGVGGYWRFATKSDNVQPGNVVGNLANQANYFNSNTGLSVTQSESRSKTQNYLTDVGAFMGSASAYGTFDQSGDVSQWTDTAYGPYRFVDGISWNLGDIALPGQDTYGSTQENAYIGFRVATVPEPAAGVSLLLASGLLLARRKRSAVL